MGWGTSKQSSRGSNLTEHRTFKETIKTIDNEIAKLKLDRNLINEFQIKVVEKFLEPKIVK